MTALTLSELLTSAKVLREDKRALEVDVKNLSQSLDAINVQIQAKLHAEGVERTSVNGITVSLSKQTVFNIIDYSAFQDYIVSSGKTHLLQKRVSNIAVRELLEDPFFLQDHSNVPGLEGFEQEKLNMRVS